MVSPHIRIRRFRFWDAYVFSKLRIDIDNESDFLLAKKGERRENALHVIIRLLISQRRIVTFLACQGDEVVGYVSLVFPKFLKLRGNAYLTIGVREKYRGQGIGTLLMEQAESYAREKKCRRMELEVFGRNTGAIELYKRRGYEIEGVKKDAIDMADGYDDIIIMAKSLR